MDSADDFTLLLVTPLRRAAALTTIVCLWYLVRLWWKGELYGMQEGVFVLWFVAALAIQFASGSVWVWIAGFLAELALAIVLVLKDRWTDFA